MSKTLAAAVTVHGAGDDRWPFGRRPRTDTVSLAQAIALMARELMPYVILEAEIVEEGVAQ